MRHITGRAAGAAHPSWCHRARCRAGLHQLGEHRSEPISVVAGRSRLVATRVLTVGDQRDESHWLELLLVVPLAGVDERARSGLARRILDGLAVTTTRLLRGAR